MKKDCSKFDTNERTNGRTNISISWAPVGAKKFLVPYNFLIDRQKEEQEGWADCSASDNPWDAWLVQTLEDLHVGISENKAF